MSQEKLNFFTDPEPEPLPPTGASSSADTTVDTPVDTEGEDNTQIVIDLEESEDGSLLPEGYEAEQLVESSRTHQHPVMSGWFKIVVVGLGVIAAFGFLMLWYNSAKGVKIVKEKETRPVRTKQEKVKRNKDSDRVSNALSGQRAQRDRVYADMKEEDKEREKSSKAKSPSRSETPSKRTASTRVQRTPPPPPRYIPPPRPRYTPPPRVITAPPAPQIQTPPPVAVEPVDRSPVFGGQLPETQAQPDLAETPSSSQPGQLVSNPPEQTASQQPTPQPSQSALVAQQTAFMKGQTTATIPSGTTLKAKVESEAIADSSATFTAITTEAMKGIPAGSEVKAQIVRLASGGYFEAELVEVNGSPVPPGTTRISKGNGQLLQAKGGQPKKGFFQSQLGQMITGFAQDAGQSWLQDQLGGNQALNNLSRDVIVMANGATQVNPVPTDPEEKSVLIPRGEIVITFEQDAYI